MNVPAMNMDVDIRPVLDPRKFQDPDTTVSGEARAGVALKSLHTLWFNTGTLCNIVCAGCYVESGPRNDRLAYITRADVSTYLDEAARDRLPVEEIGLTGGEPFMNPEIEPILALVLNRGFRLLVLTNAMQPMMHHRQALRDLARLHGERLVVRVSLDHYDPDLHDRERGKGGYARSIAGLRWLAENGIRFAVAARTLWDETEAALRAGFARLFARESWPLDAMDPRALVLFPEMNAKLDVPEITTACWGILKRSPDSLMCASARMVVKRKGAASTTVVACTLLPYDTRFEFGATLAEARQPVKLNHPHCARFCVLGGGRCA